MFETEVIETNTGSLQYQVSIYSEKVEDEGVYEIIVQAEDLISGLISQTPTLLVTIEDPCAG